MTDLRGCLILVLTLACSSSNSTADSGNGAESGDAHSQTESSVDGAAETPTGILDGFLDIDSESSCSCPPDGNDLWITQGLTLSEDTTMPMLNLTTSQRTDFCNWVAAHEASSLCIPALPVSECLTELQAVHNASCTLGDFEQFFQSGIEHICLGESPANWPESSLPGYAAVQACTAD